MSMVTPSPSLAVEREAGRWLERGDPRLEGPGAAGGALLDREPLPFDERVSGRAVDADDARWR